MHRRFVEPRRRQADRIITSRATSADLDGLVQKIAAAASLKAYHHNLMNIQCTDAKTAVVTGLLELVAANAAQVRDEIRAALPATTVQLDLDFSSLTFLDSSGLGMLISLHKTLRSRNGLVRLLKPATNVRQILELTRLHHVFEIVPG